MHHTTREGATTSQKSERVLAIKDVAFLALFRLVFGERVEVLEEGVLPD